MTTKKLLPLPVLDATMIGLRQQMEFCLTLNPGGHLQKRYLANIEQTMNFIRENFPKIIFLEEEYEAFLVRIEEKSAADHGPDPAA